MSKPDSFLIPEFKPGGKDTPFSAGRMNRIVRAVNALLRATIVRGQSDEVVASDQNVVFQIKDAAVAQAATTSVSVVACKLKSVQGDYLTCNLVDTWTGVEGAQVLVAKDPKLRESLEWESFGDVTWRYTYGNGVALNRIRTKIEGTMIGGPGGTFSPRSSEAQMVAPAWCLEDVIYAIPAQTGVTVSRVRVPYLHICNGRAWARIFE